MTFARAVSPIEWAYLAAAPLVPPLVVQLIVEGTGHIGPAALTRAVAVASEACPGARLARHGRHWVDSGQAPPVRVVQGIGWDSGPLRSPIDPGSGPTCEVLLSDGGGDTTAVVFRASHAVMDARGVTAWAADVFRALRREHPVGAQSGLFDLALLRQLGASPKRPSTPLTWRSPFGGGARTRQYGWRRRTLEGDHPGLMARVLSVVAARAAAGDRSRFLVPVDLRRHLPAGGSAVAGGAVAGSAAAGGTVAGGAVAGGTVAGAAVVETALAGASASASPAGTSRGTASTANLTLPVFLDMASGDTWEQAYARLYRALAEQQELAVGASEQIAGRLPLAVLRASLAAADRATRRADRYLCTALFSQLGRLDPASFSAGSFTASTCYSPPVHAPLIPVGFTAVQLPGHAELTMSYQLARGSEAAADALLDAVVAAVSPPEPAPPTSDAPVPEPVTRERVTREPATAGRVATDLVTAGTASADPVGTASPVEVPPVEVPPVAVPPVAVPPVALPPIALPPIALPPIALPLVAVPLVAMSATESRNGAASGATSGRGTIVDLFLRQVALTPDAVALTGPQGAVSYVELDRRADVVAAELRARDVGPGVVVALLADRTTEAVSALWGILKAGAAYLPLDPQHPDDRTGYLLADSGAVLCLVQRSHAGRITSAPSVVLEDLPVSGAARARGAARPEDLAYVIYTSGSTGPPKGVQIEHRNLAAYAAWAAPRYRIGRSTRFALFTSLAFDLSGTSLLLPLLSGGSVALLPGEPTPSGLRDVLTSHGANALKLTPTHLGLLAGLASGNSESPVRPGRPARPAYPGFRTVIVGGEQLSGAVASAARQMFGVHCAVFNEYGPTEATIGCVVHSFDPECDDASVPVPIGRPVPGTGITLLDGDRHEVPHGRIGEIHLTGAQLARGYLGRPELDRERFVRLADGSRAYRTGDLARLLPDGTLRYVGRADEQVKIRGHRVEPGEVAAALEKHPAVARAVVVARARDSSGELGLYAYLVPRAEAGEDELRSHLSRLLPAYMVPARILTVDDLPMTAGGKVDVPALPVLPHAEAAAAPGSAGAAGGPPAASVAAAVMDIWSQILGRRLGANDHEADFHQLGGDSLSLMTMLIRVSREVVGTSGGDFLAEALPVIAHPTIAAVCRAVVDTGRKEGKTGGTAMASRRWG